MTDKGRDGNAERTHQHPEHRIDFAVGCPSGHRGRAEGVDGGLNQHVGDAEQRGLDARRQPDFDDVPQYGQMEADFPYRQLVAFARACQKTEHQQRADGLRENGGQSRAGDAHMKHKDEQQVEYKIGQRADDQNVQRPPRIADGAQDAGADVVKQVENHSCEIDAQIGYGRRKDVVGRIHHSQHRRRQKHSDHSQQQAAGDAHRDGGVHRVLGGLLLFRAVELGNDDGCARGKPYKKADKQIDERTRRAADGRKRLLADEFAHDGRVHGVVELLEKGAEQDGEEKQQKLLPDHAFCDLIDLLLFIHSLSPSSILL